MQWFVSLKRYFSSTIDELKKVVWPSRSRTIRLTAIVLGVTVVLGAMLTGVDYLLGQGLKFLLQ